MLNDTKKAELNKISLTGIRALILLSLLIKSPRSMEEIREEFVKLNIMAPENSDDIIRIDINTLRNMGCVITKANAKTNYKFVLEKHPFVLNITSEEIKFLKKAYDKVKQEASLALLLKYDELFNKLAHYISDDEIREELYGISILKSFNTNMARQLADDCKNNRIIKLVYENIAVKRVSEKEIYAQNLVIQNDKLYLQGYDLKKKSPTVLNIKRIRSILSRTVSDENINVEAVNVKFFLKSFWVNNIEQNESIVEKLPEGVVVEGNYYNEFFAMQRILSFGANCKVLEPQEFREKVVEKLKSMKGCYND